MGIKETLERRKQLCHTMANVKKVRDGNVRISEWIHAKPNNKDKNNLEWEVYSMVGGEHRIGEIKKAKDYSFFSDKDVCFDSKCLRTIANYLDLINKHA